MSNYRLYIGGVEEAIPPEVSTATGDPEFTLLSASSGTIPFTVGQAVRKGNMPSASGIAVVGATGQVTIKSTWDDSSAKFVIVAGTAALTADTPLTVTLESGTSSSGTALATTDLPSGIRSTGIEIDAGAFGAATWSGTDFDSPFETWVSGHAMSSWTYRKQIGSDTHLVAWLEVRLYASGAVEVLPWVENGYLLVTGPTSKSEVYTFTLGGTDRYSDTIDIPHHCRTVLVDGSVTSYWLGTAHDVIVKHESGYMQGTKLVPAYFAETPSAAAVVTALPATWSPLSRGSFPAGNLGGVGGNVYVGMLPEWDTVYLTSQASSTYKAVVFNGYAAGRYGFHYRDETTNRAPLLSDHPTLNIKPEEGGWTTTPNASGTASDGWSLDHQPNIGWLAYLVTGRRYFLDEVQLCAATNILFISSSTRESGSALAKSENVPTTRGVAWYWRMLAQAAAITPNSGDDADLYADFIAQLQSNVAHYHSKYIGAGNDPYSPVGNTQGFVEPAANYEANLNGSVAAGATTTSIPISGTAIGYGTAPDDQFIGFDCIIGAETRTVTDYVASTNTLTVSPAFSSAPAESTSVAVSDGNWWMAQWMDDYLTAVWGQTLDIVPGLDATNLARMERLFTWKAQSIVGRLGSSGADEFLYRDFAPYVMAYAPSSAPDWTGAGPWFADWGEIWDATYSGLSSDGALPYPFVPGGSDTSRTEGPLRNNWWGSTESVCAQALPAIAAAVRHEIPGAEEGLRRLTTAANFAEVIADFDAAPGWAVAPYALPKWRRGQAINEWREILNTASADTPATNTAYQRRYLGTVSTGATTTVIPMQAGGFDEYGTPADGQFSGLNVPLTIGGESRAITGYVASTNTFTVGIAFSSAPTNGTAAVVNGQASAGPARLDPYCGMTVDTRRSEIWQLGNGGHGDYYGNEVMKIDLMADEPEWREWMVGSSGYVINDNQFTAQYVAGNAWYDDDGVSGALPCSQHTYYCQQFIERHGRAVRFGGGSISSSGTAFVDVESFDADVAEGVNGWDAQYTYKAAILSGYTGTYAGGSTVIRPPVCRDPRTDHVYTMSAAGFREFTPSVAGPSGADTGGTWAGMVGGVANGAGTGDATAVDTIRGRMLMAGGTTLTYWVYDIDGGTGWTSGTFTGAAASSISGGVVYEGWGLTFVPEIDAYLMRDGAAGGTVLKINASTFEVTDLGATDGASIPATAARSGATEQVYNKFQYVPKLRGVVYAPANGENLWFLRTH